MRLSADEVQAVFAAAAAAAKPGIGVDFKRVAELLNERLQDGLVGSTARRAR